MLIVLHKIAGFYYKWFYPRKNIFIKVFEPSKHASHSIRKLVKPANPSHDYFLTKKSMKLKLPQYAYIDCYS